MNPISPEPSDPRCHAGVATGIGPFLGRWLRVFLLGLPGIVVLALQFDVPRAALPPELQDASPMLVALLAVLNPLLLLLVAAGVGAAVVPATGLRSIVASGWRGGTGVPSADRPPPDKPQPDQPPQDHSVPGSGADLLPAIAWGLAAGVVLHLADRAVTPFLGAEWAAIQARAEGPVSFGGVVAGIFYGGFTEEVLMRWGVMGFVVWLVARLSGRRARTGAGTGAMPDGGSGLPGPGAAWTGILVAALLFGAGHLPAVALLADLTPALVLRTVGLNMIGGILYGWLFWRRNLESAIAAHAATHVGFALLRWLGL